MTTDADRDLRRCTGNGAPPCEHCARRPADPRPDLVWVSWREVPPLRSGEPCPLFVPFRRTAPDSR